MKKALGLIILIAFLFAASVSYAATVGFIDVQKVFTSYKETQKAQDELGKKEKEFKKELEKKQEEIEQARKNGKKPSEIEGLTKKLEEELAPQRKELLELNEKLTVKLQEEILSAVKKVAGKLGIDLVLDKQVIITGGTDLTEMVVRDLNK